MYPCLSSSVFFPWHSRHIACRLSSELLPPRNNGRMWSTSNTCERSDSHAAQRQPCDDATFFFFESDTARRPGMQKIASSSSRTRPSRKSLSIPSLLTRRKRTSSETPDLSSAIRSFSHALWRFDAKWLRKDDRDAYDFPGLHPHSSLSMTSIFSLQERRTAPRLTRREAFSVRGYWVMYGPLFLNVVQS